MTVEQILDRLDSAKPTGENKWLACCPAHPDRKPSLSIGLGDDDRVLLSCHAGCSTEEIVAALALELSDLFADGDWRANGANGHTGSNGSHRQKAPTKPPEELPSERQISEWGRALKDNTAALARLRELKGWSPVAAEQLGVGFDGKRLVFPIRDQDGQLVNVVKYTPKPNGPESKSVALRGRPRGLFPRPEGSENRDLWIVEGEGDSVAGATLGIAAIGVPGVQGWKADYSQRFSGRSVTVAMDCDPPGRKVAERIVNDLTAAGVECRLVDLDPKRSDGFDLSDFLLGAQSPEAARNKLLKLASAAAVRQIAVSTPTASAESSDPDAGPAWPDSLDSAALHGVAGDVVRITAPHTEADPAAILVQFLVATGNAMGRSAGFKAEATFHGTNLYALIVGRTSKGRKGSSWGQARWPVELAAGEEWAGRIKSGISSGEG